MASSFSTGQIYISLCEFEEDIADVEMTIDGHTLRAFYTIFIGADKGVTLPFEGLQHPFVMALKILTHDTLILQRGNGELEVMQRQADTAFADSVIEGL